MSTRFHNSAGMLSLALVAFAASASAQPPGTAGAQQGRATISAGKASPQERGVLTRKFVTKWGAYVQRIYGVPVGVWSKRMVPNFVSADASNFRNALKRDTFEGAMAELAGTGHRLSDSQAIDRLAKLAPGASASGPDIVVAKFGDLNQDLVYTPVQPCRILDTRSTAAGAIPAGTTRSFVAINASNFTSQGGSATNCGTLNLSATAVALNFTAVPIGAGGHATVFPFGTAQPNTASVNYPATQPINNAIIARIPNPLSSFDFTVYTTSTTHYVADIVGYFAPPLATALQCVETDNDNLDIAGNGGTGNAVAPACAAGYTQTSTNCETTSWMMPIVFFQNGTCSARNGDTATRTLRASRTCCRVPGR
jgi:hypothetical protein